MHPLLEILFNEGHCQIGVWPKESKDDDDREVCNAEELEVSGIFSLQKRKLWGGIVSVFKYCMVW